MYFLEYEKWYRFRMFLNLGPNPLKKEKIYGERGSQSGITSFNLRRTTYSQLNWKRLWREKQEGKWLGVGKFLFSEIQLVGEGWKAIKYMKLFQMHHSKPPEFYSSGFSLWPPSKSKVTLHLLTIVVIVQSLIHV